MDRTPLIAANWKMYKTLPEARTFFAAWTSMPPVLDREVAFFPPFPLLHAVRGFLRPGENFGAQNLHEAREGAFTGEVSASMLVDAGCAYALVGHSERRHVFGEPEERLAAKVRTCLTVGLRPILCVGETLAQREAGRTLEVVLGQLSAGLGAAPPPGGFDLAYEPVWAIGTGKVARPEDAAEVHAALRQWLGHQGVGGDVRILYGGSVKPDNASALLATEGVEGLLVGGASLDASAFHAIAMA